MKGSHAALALTAGAAVALGAGALYVACAANADGSVRRKVTSALLSSSLLGGSSCSLVVFKDDDKGVSATAVHVEWPRRASIADVCAAVDAALGITGARLFLQATHAEVLCVADVCTAPRADGSAVVLLATAGGAPLSAAVAAAALPPLAPPPRGPAALPFVGNLLVALHGPYPRAPPYNLWANLFTPDKLARWGDTLTLRIGDTKTILGGVRAVADDDAAVLNLLITCDPDVAAELLEREDDFPKMWNRMRQVAIGRLGGNGLFTSSTPDPDWQTAHGIVPRLFNQLRIKNYFPTLLEKTRSFMHCWAQMLPPAGAAVADVNNWLACMTADAVVKASMGMDMMNVERLAAGRPLHEFMEAFRFGLGYSSGGIKAADVFGAAAYLPFFNAHAKMEARFAASVAVLRELAADMVERTRNGEIGGPDSMLTAMLQEKSPATGRVVRYSQFYGHIVNVMVAGHETTAATLGWTMHYLTVHPECMARAVAEVDAVIGAREPVAADIPKLPYLEACFREALRLHPPLGFISRDAAHDTTLKGKWLVRRGQRIQLNIIALQRRDDLWGGKFGDANGFNPDRFMDGAEKGRHPQAFLPWGFGVRACIGAQFALWEAKTFLAMLLQRFTLAHVAGYTPEPSMSTGGAAPTAHELTIHAKPRAARPVTPPSTPPKKAEAAAAAAHAAAAGNGCANGRAAPAFAADGDGISSSSGSSSSAAGSSGRHHNTPLLVLYGSNSGTSDAFAAQVVDAARGAGFNATLSSLDQAAGSGGGGDSLPTEGAVIIITSTYNGAPPDNARQFSKWAEAAAATGDGAKGVRYAVFGVGNSQWAATFQAFPRRVDAWLAASGGTRLMALQATDADSADFTDVFESWLDQVMSGVQMHFGVSAAAAAAAGAAAAASAAPPQLRVTLRSLGPGVAAPPAIDMVALLRAKAPMLPGPMLLLSNRELQAPGSERSTRHIELQLQEGTTYATGDHLEVLGTNTLALVDLALSALGLSGSEAFEWLAFDPNNVERGLAFRYANSATGSVAVVLLAAAVLQRLCDLSAPPPRKLVAELAAKAPCPPDAARLARLAEPEAYKEEVVKKRLTLPELLLANPSAKLDLSELVNALPRLPPRHFSISSSPLADATKCSITVGVVSYTTPTGRVHNGAASGHLATTTPGDFVLATVRNHGGAFRPPSDPSTPMIMVGPGTGIAPLMGFLQERAALQAAGTALGEAHLFFGCRSPKTDYIYQDVLEGYKKSGVLTGLHVAFSRDGDTKVYVQDLIAQQGADLWALFEAGAHVYICGDAKRMAPDVRAAFKGIASAQGGRSASAADTWMGALQESGRYAEDVWAAGG